jgi:hypothetical protein
MLYSYSKNNVFIKPATNAVLMLFFVYQWRICGKNSGKFVVNLWQISGKI